MRTLAISLFSLLASCSLAFDGGRHTGGTGTDGGPPTDAGPRPDAPGTDARGPDTGVPDAGCIDSDGDGHPAESCGGDDCDDTDATVYPGAPPICGNGASERCPGDARPDPTVLGPMLTIAGIIPRIELLSPPAGLKPGLALAASPVGGGGYGRAIAIGLVNEGSFVRLARRDLALDAPEDHVAAEIQARTGVGATVADITPVANASGVDLRRLPGDRIGIGIIATSDVTGVVGWRGILDLVAGTSVIDRLTAPGTVTAWGEPAIVSYGMAWRESGGGSPPTLRWYVLGDPPAIGLVDEGVPTGHARMIGTEEFYGMIQHPTAGTCFFSAGGGQVRCGASAAPEPAAFAVLGPANTFLHAYAQDGDVYMLHMDCPMNDGCVPAPRVSPVPFIDTGADAATAPDLARIPGGDGMLLFVARHADGDVLAMQPVMPFGGAAGERIDILDLRGTNRRVLDAELDIIRAPQATTAAVAATLGESFSPDAERLVFTGIRACQAD